MRRPRRPRGRRRRPRGGRRSRRPRRRGSRRACPACGVHWVQAASDSCLACRLGRDAAPRFGDPGRHAEEAAAVGDALAASAWRPVSPDIVFAARGSCAPGKGALYLPDFVFSLPHAIFCLDILTNCHRDEPPSFREMREDTYQSLTTMERPVVFLYTNFGSYLTAGARLRRQEDPPGTRSLPFRPPPMHSPAAPLRGSLSINYPHIFVRQLEESGLLAALRARPPRRIVIGSFKSSAAAAAAAFPSLLALGAEVQLAEVELD
eukprot:tig00000180_g13634.t1